MTVDFEGCTARPRGPARGPPRPRRPSRRPQRPLLLRQRQKIQKVLRPVKNERRELIDKLERGVGTTEDAERWVARLKEIAPLFHSSDRMLGLDRGVKARRIVDRLTAEMGEWP